MLVLPHKTSVHCLRERLPRAVAEVAFFDSRIQAGDQPSVGQAQFLFAFRAAEIFQQIRVNHFWRFQRPLFAARMAAS